MAVAMAAVGKFIGRFWREGIIVLLLVGIYFGSAIVSGKINDLNTNLGLMQERAGGLQQQVETLRTSNTTYKETLGSIEQLTEMLRGGVRLSQADIDKISGKQQEILYKINSINLEPMTCEQKFDWMIEEAKNPGGTK